MQAFEIFFLNNGSAVFQTEDFCHAYDDMAQLAADFAQYQADGNTNGWDGDEPEFRMEYDFEIERNGGYFCLTDLCWDEAPADGWGNVNSFSRALAETGFKV